MDKIYEEPEEAGKISKYNSGVAQIYRLNELWNKCLLYKQKGDYKNWKITLDSIWSELARDLETFPDKKDKAYITYKRFIIRCFGLQDNKNLLYQAMLEEEIFLGALQNELGKGTALKDADEDYIE